MLAIHVRLLHGAIRAGSPDDTVMAGGEQRGEWPPSPARLFSALVAADGTRARCRVTDGSELAVLEAAPAPLIYADPAGSTVWTQQQPRFVVVDRNTAGLVQDYPARLSAEVRPGTKVAPREPSITYLWDVDVDDATLAALRLRAARVGYLGCADSPVQLSVATEAPEPEDPSRTWKPSQSTGVTLPVPYRGFLAALDDAFDLWAGGEGIRRSWIPSRRERYAITGDVPTATEQPTATVIWLSFDHRVAGHKALLVGETLRAAVLSHYDDGPGTQAELWRVHGHQVPPEVSPPYQLVRFLPLANVGHAQSDGSIHGAAVWIPPGASPDLVEGLRATVHDSVHELRAPGLSVRVEPTPSRGGKWTTRAQRWNGPARRWFSASPVVVERGRRRGPSLDDVREWFRHAGHPEPARVRISPVPTAPGVVRLSGRQVHRDGRDRHPFVWIDVEYDEPVLGPLCVGRSRSLGLGLLAPVVQQTKPGAQGGER